MQTAPNEASGADQSHPRKAVEKLDVPVREVCVCVCVCIQIIGPMRIIATLHRRSFVELFGNDSGFLTGLDRTSVVKGKSVSVRVTLGGRRSNKKKNRDRTT